MNRKTFLNGILAAVYLACLDYSVDYRNVETVFIWIWLFITACGDVATGIEISKNIWCALFIIVMLIPVLGISDEKHWYVNDYDAKVKF